MDCRSTCFAWRASSHFRVDWPGLATRTLALAAAVVLARLALARPAAPASTRAATWYGYAAFVLALPYPVLRTWWALGGTLGLDVARRGRPGLRPMAAVHPVAAGGRSVPAPGANAALDAAPAVAGRRLVRHRHRRHDRAGGLLVAGHRVSSAAAILAPGASRSGSSVSSTAAGSSGLSPPVPPPARISCVVQPCERRSARGRMTEWDGRRRRERGRDARRLVGRVPAPSTGSSGTSPLARSGWTRIGTW